MDSELRTVNAGPRQQPASAAAREQGKPSAEPSRTLVRGQVAVDQLWYCRTCGACMQECPVFIEQRGHPWRGTQLQRTTWIESMDVPEFTGEQDLFANAGVA